MNLDSFVQHLAGKGIHLEADRDRIRVRAAKRDLAPRIGPSCRRGRGSCWRISARVPCSSRWAHCHGMPICRCPSRNSGCGSWPVPCIAPARPMAFRRCCASRACWTRRRCGEPSARSCGDTKPSARASSRRTAVPRSGSARHPRRCWKPSIWRNTRRGDCRDQACPCVRRRAVRSGRGSAVSCSAVAARAGVPCSRRRRASHRFRRLVAQGADARA